LDIHNVISVFDPENNTQTVSGPFSLIAMGEKVMREMFHPEAAGEFQEGLNAPVASGRKPAGTTEGGDNLPRRYRTRGEANRA
jgi:hypothetical protein